MKDTALLENGRGMCELSFRLYRVEQRKRMFFKWLVLGKGGVDDGHELADRSDNAVSVAMAHAQSKS
jgi:hypothetical protein